MPETVAFLFSDLQGSTRLLGALGADAYAELLTTYRQAVEAAAAAEDGRVVDREGDGLFLSFPTAAAALRTAHRAQIAIWGLPRSDRVSVAARMGIHAGEALRHGEGWVGLSVHRAARIASAAHGGQVLVSEAARALAADEMPHGLGLRDLGRQRLKDLERDERIYQLLAPQLRTEFPPLRTLDATPNNLVQQPTSFVGRGDELAMVARLLAESRLLTLTGVGGVGKSRLALQAAADTLEDHHDGVWLVELAPLTDPGGVIGRVASVLSIREESDAGAGRRSLQDRLIEHLEQRELLLILDNCEHLLDEVGRLADLLLRFCPRVRILATSREGLGIGGETAWRIPSLSLPDTEPASATALTDAVRLFVERARAMAPDFELTPATTPAVTRICHRLDGIPLAIELAAARVRGLAVDELATRLDESFRLLTGGSRTALPRQQTLDAAIDWSYQLLSDAERTLLARLAVFSGGFTLETVEEVCAGGNVDETNVVDLLLQLVDKSLVTPLEGTSGPARYRLLETIRQFAQDHLGEAEMASIQRRHRDWFSAVAQAADTHLDDSDQLALLDRLHDDRDNLQAALERSVRDGGDQQAANLAEALGWYRVKQGHYRQGVELMRVALGHLDPEAEPEREAELRVRLAGTRYSMGDQGALADAERARSLVADAEPSAVKVRALTEFATLHLRINQRDADRSISAAREAIVAARAIGDRFAESHALRELGVALSWAGQVDEGVERLREALAMARETGNPTAILGVYLRLYITLLDFAQRQAEANALADEAIAWLDAGGERWAGSAALLSWFAMGFQRSGDWARSEETLERCARYHREGAVQMSYLSLRALQDWMRGNLDEAAQKLGALVETAPPSRYFRLLYPIEAGIRADEGRIDAVRTTAERHLTTEVGPMEESTKAGTLHALVRAEVDAALDASGSDHADHLRRAQEAIDTIRDLIERFPPATLAGLQLEIADTYLLLCEAEVTRASDPQPHLWRALLDRPWYAYWRLYARCRLGESLLAASQGEEGSRELRLAWQQASEMGAQILRDEIDAVARRADVPLS